MGELLTLSTEVSFLQGGTKEKIAIIGIDVRRMVWLAGVFPLGAKLKE
jgi:hypothetical protein